MPLELPAIKDLASEKAEILATAARVLPTLLHSENDPKARARIAAWKALEDHTVAHLAQCIEPAILGVLTTHEAIEGERATAADPAAWDAALDVAIDEELAAVRTLNVDGFNKFAIGVRIDETGRAADVAKTLALFCARTAPYTATFEDIGKQLAKVGIVSADLIALAKLAPASGTPAVAASAPAPAGVPSEGNPVAPPPPPPPVVAVVAPPPPLPVPVELDEQMPDAIDMRPPPGSAEIAKAYSLMYQSAGPDANDMAGRLGCSRNTFVNWCTGKSTPKCSTENARFLAAYCTKAAADLQAACDIFSRVR